MGLAIVAMVHAGHFLHLLSRVMSSVEDPHGCGFPSELTSRLGALPDATVVGIGIGIGKTVVHIAHHSRLTIGIRM